MSALIHPVGVIDVGSNSVRCAVFENGNAVWKRLITSRLGEGVFNGFLSPQAMERTSLAISELLLDAKSHGAKTVCAFATEAVRRAVNGQEFLSMVKQKTDLDVLVVDGKTEASLALIGALGGESGCVIDLGGASTEIVVSDGKGVIYARSLNVGAVVLNDVCGRDRDKLTAYITQKCREYGSVPKANPIVAVGGTATSLAACRLGLSFYDASLVHGSTLSIADLDSLAERFSQMTAEQISACYPVDARRAEIILGGALLLKGALMAAGGSSLTVSESDNLEGFYTLLMRGDISVN